MSKSLLDIPYIKTKVKNRFVSDQQDGYTECYIFSVTLLLNRPLLFSIHLINGAVYSRLPIWAFNKYGEITPLFDPKAQDPWGSVGSSGEAIKHAYLSEYSVETNIDGKSYVGDYLFTIDYMSGGFALCPEQHKNSHIIELLNGCLVALPNNQCLFKDHHFTEESDLKLKRNSTYFTLR